MKAVIFFLFILSCQSTFENSAESDHILTIKTYRLSQDKEYNKILYIKINEKRFIQTNILLKNSEDSYRIYHKGRIDSIRIYKACLESNNEIINALWTIKLENVKLGTARVLENKFEAKGIKFFYERKDSF